MDSHRNKFVIRQESGHMGSRCTTIVATREDLAVLADEMQRKLREGYRPPFVSREATEAHGRSSRIYLQFEPVSEQAIDAYHETKNPLWSWFIRPALGLVIFSLAAIGGLRVWHWFTTGAW